MESQHRNDQESLDFIPAYVTVVGLDIRKDK